MAEVISKVSCKSCGAPLQLAPGEILVTCDYCGTVFNQATDKAFILEHSMIPNQLDGSRVEKAVRGWMKGGTKPLTLAGGSSMEKVELSFLPFFVIEVKAKTEYKGGMTRTGGWVPREGTLEKEYDWKVLGRRGTSFPTREYRIPLDAKAPFSIYNAPKKGQFLNSELDEKEAVTSAKQGIEDHHRALLSQEVDSLDRLTTEYEVGEVEFIHVPVWDVRYGFKGQSYDVLVDGSTGTVIRGDVPPPDTSAKGFLATFRSALFGN